jgi:hypothetical protein
MKKTVAIIACAFVSQYGSAQWAGSSSDAGSSRQVPIEQKSGGNGKFTMGFPIRATLVSAVLNDCNYSLTDVPVNGVTVDEGAKLGLMMAISKPVTSNPNLELGIEFGFSYGFQTLKYQTYSTWSFKLIENENQVDCYHFGTGLTIQYNFPMTDNSNFYVKAILGPGFVNVTDENSDSYLKSDYVTTFYGGGVLGVEGSGFFAEGGVTSVGFFRVGLKL